MSVGGVYGQPSELVVTNLIANSGPELGPLSLGSLDLCVARLLDSLILLFLELLELLLVLGLQLLVQVLIPR